jgi:PAS domain S-box-containing protein
MPEQLLFRRLTIAFGLLAITTAIMGILTAHFGIILIGSANPNNRTIALSAALIWIFLGSVLAYQTVKPMQRSAGLIVQAVLVVIAVIEAIEFIVSVQGGHFFIENLFVGAGTTILGPASSPISPVAAGLAFLAAIALVYVIRDCDTPGTSTRVQDAISMIGLAISLVSFMFVLCYSYNDPLLYGTKIIPIAGLSALAAFFIGAAFIAAAGPGAVPVKYMTGNSTSAGLLRVFIPLIIGIVLFENIVFAGLTDWFNIDDVILRSVTLVLFVIIIAFVVARVTGGMGRALERAEQELVRNNEELGAMNEELVAIDEELRQNIEELTRVETILRKSEEKFRIVADFTYDWEYWIAPDGSFVYMSPSCEQITGYTAQEFMDNSHLLDDIIHPDNRALIFEHRTRHGGADEIDPVDLRITRKDGEVRWIGHACRIVFAKDGTPLGRRVSNRDITDRRNAEEELGRKHDDLNALNEELSATQEVLRQNIDNLAQAETALKASNEFLEQRVAERTMQLEKAVKDAGIERQRLYDVLETLPEYVCLLDADYQMPFANKYFRENFGESHGRCCYDFLFNRTEPCETCETYSVMNTKAPHHWYWTGPNGRDYEVYDFPFTDTDGSFLILEMGIDVTERKKAQDTVKQVSAYNRSLIEASLDPLVTINPDGTISDVNTATTVVTGFSRKELIGTDFSQYLTEPDRAKAGYETVFREGTVTDYALEIQHRDGHTTPVLYNATIFRDESGNIAGVFAAARNITERNKAEEELKRAGAYNRSLIEASLDPLVTINPDGTISDVNTATTVVTGFSRKELIGTDFSQYFTESDRAKTGYETVFREGTVTDYALEIQHRDGHTTPVLYNATVYRDESGNIAGVFAAARNITKRKEAEAALQKAHDELEERVQQRTAELAKTNIHLLYEVDERRKADEKLKQRYEDLNRINAELSATQEKLRQNVCELEKNEENLKRNESNLKEALVEKEVLLSEIHHRVKNNLTAFISLLSLDGSYEDTKEGRALRKDLQNRARSMALIHETLYRTGKFSNVDMEIYLTTLVGYIASSYTVSTAIRTVVDVQGEALDLDRANTVGLIINELVTNSFKYAFPPGFDCMAERGEPCTIHVSLVCEDGTYILIVADNGCGLPPELDPTATKSLGLKLVNFLARHQLRAKIGAHMDKGTKFIFRLDKIEDY